MQLISKVLYKSQSCATWGEFELDYVYFTRQDFDNIKFNENEVKQIDWVDKD